MNLSIAPLFTFMLSFEWCFYPKLIRVHLSYTFVPCLLKKRSWNSVNYKKMWYFPLTIRLLSLRLRTTSFRSKRSTRCQRQTNNANIHLQCAVKLLINDCLKLYLHSKIPDGQTVIHFFYDLLKYWCLGCCETEDCSVHYEFKKLKLWCTINYRTYRYRPINGNFKCYRISR